MSPSEVFPRFTTWLNRVLHLRFTETTRTLFISVGIGILTSLAIALYHVLIELAHELFRAWLPDGVTGALLSIGSLALAGALVGLLYDRFIGHERHHGVAGVIEAVALTGGRLPYQKIPAKTVISAISLGAGSSVGPEDPSVQIGSNLGSFVGQFLRLPEERVKILVAAGGASAIAAAFNAPIAGVFFALEIILNGVFTTGSLGIIVLASVISAAATKAIQPVNPEAIGPLTYNLGAPLEILLYVPLGLLLAPIAAFTIRAIFWQHDWWHTHLHHLSRPLRTALAGAVVGLVGVFLPQILGTGREVMNGVLDGDLTFPFLLLLAIGLVKIIMTSVTLAGGFIGGVFAPALFIGTMLGAAYGQLVAFTGASPQAFAIAGMAGMVSGVLRAPITAIMIVFEVTGDYRLILPMMLTTVICMVFAERWQPDGLYTLGLARAGIRLRQGRDVDVMQSVTVREAMHTPAPTILTTATLAQLRDTFHESDTRSLCVVDSDGKLTGLVTLRDLQNAYDRLQSAASAVPLTVAEICSRQVITIPPDATLWEAIRVMGCADIGRLPVVEFESGRLLGILRRHNLIKAYNMSIARHMEDQHLTEQLRLNTLTGAHVMEIHVAQTAPIAHQALRDIRFPAESVVASIRRGSKLIVPHGDTVVQPGDRLAVVAAPEAEAHLLQLAGQADDQP